MLGSNSEGFFFIYASSKPVKELTHKTYNKGSRRQEISGRGKEKVVWNRDMRRSVEGRGLGWGTQGKQDGH